MRARLSLVLLIAAGLLVGAIAMLWIGHPPNPVTPWLAGAITVGSAEQWWYFLPDAQRTDELYQRVMMLASLVYPVVIAMLFIVWGWPMRKGVPFFPRRSLILGGVILLGSVIWYAVGWRYGVQYQGLGTLLTYVSMTVLFLGGMVLLWTWGRRRGSWGIGLLWHIGLFLWFWGFAFPWLGELCC